MLLSTFWALEITQDCLPTGTLLAGLVTTHPTAALVGRCEGAMALKEIDYCVGHMDCSHIIQTELETIAF